MVKEHHNHCQPNTSSSYKLSGRVIFWLIIAVLIFVGSKIFNLDDLSKSYIDYIELIWWAVLLGLGLGGLIDYFVPDGFVIKFLGQRKPLTLVYAVFCLFAWCLGASHTIV